MATVDTLLRLAGDLARAEKQYRECPVPQKAMAWKIMEEAGDKIRELIDGRRPATPAPESPAPCPECNGRERSFYGHPDGIEEECRTCNGWGTAPAKGSDIGTGSETSPDAARQEPKIGDLVRVLEIVADLYTSENVPSPGIVSDMVQMVGKEFPVTGIEDSKYGKLVEVDEWVFLAEWIEIVSRPSEAKPAEASDAEQIPHPVAEAEQSPQPATLDALRKLERACQDLGSAALPVWDYNPPDYLKKEWERLADVLVEIAPALAQAPTRNAGKGK